MLWDYLNLCFEKVNTALLSRLQKADQFPLLYLWHGGKAPNSHWRNQHGCGCLHKSNFRPRHSTRCLLRCLGQSTGTGPILCKRFHLTGPQSIGLANPSGRTASITSLRAFKPFKVPPPGLFRAPALFLPVCPRLWDSAERKRAL